MPNDPPESGQAGKPTEHPSEGVPASPGSAEPAKPGTLSAPPKPETGFAGAAPRIPVPTPQKEAPPQPAPLDNELVQRLKSRFGDAIREAAVDRKQAILLVGSGHLAEIARHCRDEEKFDMLVDLTAVDWPKREKRFDVVLNLYSFAKNERLRLKANAAEGEPVPSVCAVWIAANWLERECYDMFGIVFEGHPDLKRILMPDEWQGYPLRKDYDILQQDKAWVRENLGIESGQ